MPIDGNDPIHDDDGTPAGDPAQPGWRLPTAKWCARFSGQTAAVVTADLSDPANPGDFTCVMLVAATGGGRLMERAAVDVNDAIRFRIGIDAYNQVWVQMPGSTGDASRADNDPIVVYKPNWNLADGDRHVFALVREGSENRI